MRREKGITLVALIITIVVLVILVGVSINAMLNGGIIKNSDTATTGYNKEQAKETMNVKITNIQMKTYAETQTMPTLQNLADELCKDDEMQYVRVKNENMAELNKINVGKAEAILVKMKAYPYEFEIDSSLRLASIDGIKIADSNANGENQMLVDKEEYENLKNTVANLNEIGTYYTNSATISLKSGDEYISVVSINVPKGSYILQTNLQISAQVSTSGFLQGYVETSEGVTFNNIKLVRSYPQNNGYVMLPGQSFIVCNGDTKITLKAYNYLGSDREVEGIITAIKVK